MKNLNIKLLALMAFLLIGSNACAYTWGFSNHTNKTIDLKLGLMGAAGWWDGSVAPGQRFEFAFNVPSWWAGYCLHSFLWIDHRNNLPHMSAEAQQALLAQEVRLGSRELTIRMGGTSAQDMNKWKEGSIIFLPNELYDKTVKNAGKIGTGIDEFFCNTFWAVKVISAAAKSECPSVFGALITWIGGLIARGACRSREIEIIEDGNKNIEFISVVD